VIRTAVIRTAVIRTAVIRTAVIRTAVIRIAVIRIAVIRTAVIWPAADGGRLAALAAIGVELEVSHDDPGSFRRRRWTPRGAVLALIPAACSAAQLCPLAPRRETGCPGTRQ